MKEILWAKNQTVPPMWHVLTFKFRDHLFQMYTLKFIPQIRIWYFISLTSFVSKAKELNLEAHEPYMILYKPRILINFIFYVATVNMPQSIFCRYILRSIDYTCLTFG